MIMSSNCQINDYYNCPLTKRNKCGVNTECYEMYSAMLMGGQIPYRIVASTQEAKDRNSTKK